MKSIRLTNVMRDEIIKSISDQYNKQNPIPFDLEKEEENLAIYFYEKAYSAILPALKKVPNDFFTFSDCVVVCINGEQTRFNVGKKIFRVKASENYNRKPDYVADKDERLELFHAAKDAVKEWEKKKLELYREAKAVIDNCNTNLQLIEMWPQIEPFLPAYIANPEKAIRLPAIQTSRLNERLGIK